VQLPGALARRRRGHLSDSLGERRPELTQVGNGGVLNCHTPAA
jgi:hypothetical protein